MSDDDPVEISFTPVPSRTNRRDGWTAERQRSFIAAIGRGASARAAARQVGKSVRGAYALLDRPGSESFAEAWDRAVAIGREATLDCVIDRAMHGAWVPIVRRGRIVRMEFRYFDKLAMSVLAGAGRDVEEERRAAARSRQYRREVRELEREAREEKARREAAEAAYPAQLEAAVRRGEEKKRAERVVRIRRL